MRVIVNTSPLIVLDRIGKLGLLRELYRTIVRPQSVLTELQAGAPRFRVSTELLESSWIVTEPDPPEMSLRRELGEGETAVITLAFKTQADLVIIDDLQARLVAESLGIALTGTLGVLCAGHDFGKIPDLKSTIQQVQEAGFYISEDVLGTMLKKHQS